MNPPQADQSTNAPLQKINQWLHDRLSDATKARSIDALQQEFVSDVLADLLEELGVAPKQVIVTVRSSFRNDSLFLRPVYSTPPDLRGFFADPDKQRPFRFPNRLKALKGVLHKKEDVVPDREQWSFEALHRINPSNTTNPEASFPDRINSVHAEWVRNTEVPALSSAARKANYCFFAGRNKAAITSKVIELQHILAIFFPGNSDTLTKVQFADALLLAKTQELFDGLDLISQIDAKFFEAEGLQLVSELLPEFSREDIAPADKIAFAVERMGLLLTGHMIGRHGDSKTGKPAKLFFIATTFERQSDNRKSLHPRLEVYPHIYRYDHWNVSFFVTHRQIPSATKFLLWRYLRSTKHRIVETTSASKDLGTPEKSRSIRLSPSFEKMFEADCLGTEPLKQWQDAVNPPDTPDFLHLSCSSPPQRKSSRKSPWSALNQAAEPGSRSIAAFVVEGRIIHSKDEFHHRCLPRGIFAIESHYEDGFSDADIISLRSVFRGLASLIRLISHQHSPIDYRSLIARTFDQDAEPEMREDERVLRLLFLVQKLDAELFHKVLTECRKSPMRYGLDANCLTELDAIANLCPGHAHPTPEERSEILKERMRRTQELLVLKKEDVRELLLSDKVLAFLEACPENFTWASYLACMAQTLGDRIDAGTELPQFSRMVPGFSASGMFMAMVDGELRQVVKLSTAEKLRNEARLYRKWVRYRLVNAARIPLSTGLAFETTGVAGRDSAVSKSHIILPPKEGQSTESDGVLVSDLVSGGKSHEDKVRTFLDLVAKDAGGLKDHNLPSTDIICEQIQAVFGRNAGLWTTGTGASKKNTVTAVLSAFRIPGRESSERKAFEDEVARLQHMRSSAKALDFESLIRQWGQTQQQNLVQMLQKEDFRICHGDLNSRNLTWAEGLQSFFLIDFEFVGPNPNGIDQFRLVVNLLGELWLGLNVLKNPVPARNATEFNNLYTSLEHGLTYLKDLFATLIAPGGDGALSRLAEDATEKNLSSLTKILKTVLTTIDPDQTKREARWRFHWALLLLCSAAKEFSYTCRATSQKNVESILGGKKIDSVPLSELEQLIKNHVQITRVPPSFKGDYMHHFIAARLLLSLAETLDNSGNA